MKPLFDVPVSSKRVSSFTGCGACPMKKSGHTDFKDAVVGKGKKRILVIMDLPSICEDDAGRLWGTSDDESSKFLNTVRNSFAGTDVDLDKDCWRINAVQCCPRHKDWDELPQATDLCRPAVLKRIAELKPKVIIAFGSSSVRALYGHRVADMTMDIDSWHGFTIPDSTLGCHVLPCYGTYTLSLNTNKSKSTGKIVEKGTYKLVKKDIAKVIRRAQILVDKDTLPVDYLARAKKLCSFSDDPAIILQRLKSIQSKDTISIDYENSSIKPDFDNQFIKVASVFSQKQNKAFSFMIDTREARYAKVREEWKRILLDASIEKVGQNIKYEQRWTKAILGYGIEGWIWDSMLASHALYNSRLGVTGLKFQTLANFGVSHYTKDVDTAFELVTGNFGKGANTINGIDSINNDKLMEYNALDTVFNFWLYLRQKKALEKWENKLADQGARSHIDGVRFLCQSTLTFADMEEQGNHIDVVYLEAQKEWCKAEISKMKKEFMGTALYATWKKHFRPVELGSGKQLSHILYKVLGLKQKKKTSSGEDSTDKEALLSLGIPDLAPLFRMKLLEKALNTYISQITRELHGAKLHPSFTLNVAKTFRSTSTDPNLQNVPIRNKDIGIIIRGAYKPRDKKNGVLIEADLKGAEVSTAACYNHDPKFISYVADPKNDMHKDTMGLIMADEPANITKELRHVAKNKFVFPEFYGDWYKSCAETIWGEIQRLNMVDGTPAMLHLQNAGIIELPKKWKAGDFLIPEKYDSCYAGFVDHMEQVEHTFWYDMFPVYTEWKEETWQEYLRDGYADSFTGFRYTGVMDKKKVINYKIQGTAYHLNQEGINHVNRVLREQDAYTRIVNQIHDSGIYDSCEDEKKDVVALINHTMNVMIPKRHTWINVPIVVEFDVCPKGEAWFFKKGFDLSQVSGKGRFVA